MTTQPVKLTDKQLSEMTPWDIATHYGIGYSGDMNPVEHGGYFYSLADWESYGYASCVEFWHDPESGALVVQPGTVNKPDDEATLQAAYNCVDWKSVWVETGEDPRKELAFQVESVKSYCGMDRYGTAYPDLMTFNLDNWPKEWRIWRSIRNWVEALEPCRAE